MALENVVIRTEELYMSEWGTLSVMIKEEPVWEAAVKLEDESMPDVDGEEAYFSDPLDVGEHNSHEGIAPFTSPESCSAIDPDKIIVKSEPDFMDVENSTSDTELWNDKSESFEAKKTDKGSTYHYMTSEITAVNKKRYRLLPVPKKSFEVSSIGQSICMQSDERLFHCDICAARLKTKKSLKRHLLIHGRPNLKAAKPRPFTAAEKLQAVKLADELGSNRKAADREGISESSIRQWKKQRSRLERASHSRRSFRGGIPHFTELERQLYEYLLNCRAKRQAVSKELIRLKALRLFQVIYPHEQQDFKASIGWINRFFRRHSINVSQINCFKPDFERCQSEEAEGTAYNIVTVESSVTNEKDCESSSVSNGYNEVSSPNCQKLYSCHHCPAQFKLKNRMRKHLTTHIQSFRRNSIVSTRRSYTAAEKLKIIQLADELGSTTKAARRKGVTESCVRYWRKHRAKLETAPLLCQSFRGGIPHFKELEKQLYEYVLNCGAKRRAVSWDIIRSKALQLFRVIYPNEQQDFKASPGWIRRFFKRHSLSMHQINGIKSECEFVNEGSSASRTKRQNSESEKAEIEQNEGITHNVTVETTVANIESCSLSSASNRSADESSSTHQSSVCLQSNETLFKCNRCSKQFKSRRLSMRHCATHEKSFRRKSLIAKRRASIAAERLKTNRVSSELGSNRKVANRERRGCILVLKTQQANVTKISSSSHERLQTVETLVVDKEGCQLPSVSGRSADVSPSCQSSVCKLSNETLFSCDRCPKQFRSKRLSIRHSAAHEKSFRRKSLVVKRRSFTAAGRLKTRVAGDLGSNRKVANRERGETCALEKKTQANGKRVSSSGQTFCGLRTVETPAVKKGDTQLSSVSNRSTDLSSTVCQSSVCKQSNEILFSCNLCSKKFRSKRLSLRHSATHKKSFRRKSIVAKRRLTAEKLKTVKVSDELGSNCKVMNKECGGTCILAWRVQPTNIQRVSSSCESFCGRLARFEELERQLCKDLMNCYVKERIFSMETIRFEALQRLLKG